MTQQNFDPISPPAAADPADATNRRPLPTRQLAKFEAEQFGIHSGVIHSRVRLLTFTDFLKIRANLITGQQSYVDYQADFASLRASREALLRELKIRFSAPQLARLATVLGARGTKRATKAANALSIYRGMLRTFVLDKEVTFALDESFEAEVTKKVQATTSEDTLDHYLRKDQEARTARERPRTDRAAPPDS